MRYLVITGAGASRDLSADDERPLPLMADWARRLQEGLGPSLSQITGLSGVATGVEFEETLGALFRWVETLDEAERFRYMASPNARKDDGWAKNFETAINHVRSNTSKLTRRLHESLFDEFGPQRIDADKAKSAYQGLFEAIVGEKLVPDELILATTNYDRSIEIAFEALDVDLRTGFRPHGFRTPRLDPRGLGEFRKDSPSLLFLHGAVGWYRHREGHITSRPADEPYNPSLGDPAVLYPGPDKDIGRLETVELWEQLEYAASEATHILVLGHHLNDSHLVRALRQQDQARLAVTYYSLEKTTEAAAKHATAEEKRIAEHLPHAVPIAIRFGPTLSVDRRAIYDWHQTAA